MLPYIIIVSILVIYNFDSVSIFKENFIMYWVKKLATSVNIYALELALFIMHSKRISFFRSQYELLLILNSLYKKLKSLTEVALDHEYKEYILTRFFEAFIWYGEKMPSKDIYDLYLNRTNSEAFKEPTSNDNENEKEAVENASIYLDEAFIKLHIERCLMAENEIKSNVPLNNIMNPIEFMNDLFNTGKQDEFEIKTTITEANGHSPSFGSNEEFKAMTFAEQTVQTYLDVMDLIQLYQYSKKWKNSKDTITVYNKLKSIGFDKLVIKAPYFYDMDNNNFLMNYTTSMIFLRRMAQELDPSNIPASMSAEEWEIFVVDRIASEINEFNETYKNFNATIR